MRLPTMTGMAYPPSIPVVTITGQFTVTAGEGLPATGSVAFTLRGRLPLPADDTILIPQPVIAALDSDGRFAAHLPNPDGGYSYRVVERIGGQRPLVYDIIIPDNETTVDLAGLTPAVPAGDRVTYILASRIGQPGGVAPLDDTGRLPAAHLPDINTGVISVDDRTGRVNLTDRYLQHGARGAAGGVAALDGTGRLPAGQLTAHAHPYLPADQVGRPGGAAALDGTGRVPAGQLPVGDVVAHANHDHDGQYAGTEHTHDRYADTGHDHDARYADTGHAHDQYVPTATVGTDGGPAGPLLGGVLPTSQLPALAITDVHTVNTEAEMLALDAQRGDVAIRTDLPGTFILGAEPAGEVTNWILLPVPSSAVVVSVNGQKGVIVLTHTDVGAAPTSHGHPQSDITGLVAALAGKAATVHGHDQVDITGLTDTLTGLNVALVGKAAAGHIHNAADLTAGTINTARLPNAGTTTPGVVQLAGDLAGTATAPTVPGLAARVPTSRTITAGTGLTGGGNLTADRTLTVAYGTTAGTAAAGNDPRLADPRPPTVHAATHAAGGADPVTVGQSQVTGLAAALASLLPLTGGTLTGPLIIAGDGKGYRLYQTGDGLDLAAYGASLFLSVHTQETGGEQRDYFRLESNVHLGHLIGPWVIGKSPYDEVHRLDPETGRAELGGRNGLAPIRLCGRKPSPGAPTGGDWATGDVVLDSAGVWHLCTAGGTPGTWT